MAESKKAKFERLSANRKERLIREIRLISNLSNTKNYEYTEKEVMNIFDALQTELNDAKAMFERNLPPAQSKEGLS